MKISKMGIFNNIRRFTSFNVEQYKNQFQVGFKLTPDNNYDMQNRKLTNVRNGDAENDVMVKRQIEGYVKDKTKYLDGVLPVQDLKNKAVIYSPSGGVHANALYLKDSNGQEVHFFNENQDDNQIGLYIPNLKNFDSYGGRRKSSIVVTSIEQTNEGNKIFNSIEVPDATNAKNPITKKQLDGIIEKKGNHIAMKGYMRMGNKTIYNLGNPINNSDAVNLGYLKSFAVKKSGDTMSGSLIVPKDSYPVQGDPNKVISYEAQREIFMSKKEGGRMEQPIDMGGFAIENLPAPTVNDHATNKSYVDSKIPPAVDTSQFLKLDGTKDMTGNLGMGGNKIKNVGTPSINSVATNVFPPSMTNVRVDVVSTSLNIGQQATKLFTNYSRSIVHLHKWSITPPEFIYIDLKCQGTASSSAQGTGYLIVYGIKGSQNLSCL